MSAPNPYFQFLREEVLEKAHALDSSISLLSALTQSQFSTLSQLIQNTLTSDSEYSKNANNTISVSTLERIYKYGYTPNVNDSRVVTTLNKLARFADYPNWESFVKNKKRQYRIKHRSLEELLADIVIKADEAEFAAYKALPEIKTEELLKYLTPTGTAFKRIYNILTRHSTKKWVLTNEGNPSGYRRYKLWIESINQNEAIVKTEEYWYLRWFDLNSNKYVNIYNEKNEQTWTLAYEKSEWKVTDTYYP
ncbi:MAG: hypothetical protein H3C64_02725 [Candidatus Kuenenia stuttgartiensis]|nr:hypothetical protein [Candidatus Kuenenia stuttgartiensis]